MRLPNPFLVVLLAIWPAAAALAQIPNEPARDNLRAEFLARTYEDVRVSLADWTAAINGGDPKRIKTLVVPDLFLGPLEGWLAHGPEAVDSATTYFRRMAAYRATPLDFDASGSIAYLYASVVYQYTTPKGRDYREVDAIIVLNQRGDVWKIRSYVEKARPAGPSP